MSKCLIIHHLETCWKDGYHNKGTSFEELCEKVRTHIKRSNYNKVILTRFEDNRLEQEHLINGLTYTYIDDVHSYMYGWEEGNIQGEEGVDWVKGGNHSDIVLLDYWMKPLNQFKEVRICGAFDGECIEDLEIALSALNIKYKRLENLIV